MGHIVSMYSESGVKKRAEAPVGPDLFRRYVSFARRWARPELTDEAHESLVKAYLEMRNMGTAQSITATPRILESLIRISESLTKMELRERVTRADVDEAQRLLKAATYAAAVDPETGKIDMEQLIVGVGAGRRKRAKEIESTLQEILEEKEKGSVLNIDTVRASLNEKMAANKQQLISETEFSAALKAVEEDGRVLRKGKNLEVR